MDNIIKKEFSQLYHYIIVRKDLPIGFITAQIVHASGQSVIEKVPEGTHAVVLSVKDESKLREISKLLEKQEIKHVLIEETDAPYTGSATAIGIEPTRNRSKIRKYLSSLPLLKGESVPDTLIDLAKKLRQEEKERSLESAVRRAELERLLK